jgi:hypothetical protein
MEGGRSGKPKLSKKARKELKRRGGAGGDAGPAHKRARQSTTEVGTGGGGAAAGDAGAGAGGGGSKSKVRTSDMVYQDFMQQSNGMDTATKLFELANIPEVGYRCNGRGKNQHQQQQQQQQQQQGGHGSASTVKGKGKGTGKGKGAHSDSGAGSNVSVNVEHDADVLWIRQDPAVAECTVLLHLKQPTTHSNPIHISLHQELGTRGRVHGARFPCSV